MVEGNFDQYELHEEDFGGHTIGEVACISCRPLCTNKVMRRYHGGPLFMCKRKEATKEFLANEFARSHPGETGQSPEPGGAAGPTGPMGPSGPVGPAGPAGPGN